MEIIIIGIGAIAILAIGICIFMRLNNKNKELDEETRKFNNDKVVNELVNENSELYKLIKEYVHISVELALGNGGYDYNYFKANMAESFIYALDKEIEEHGPGVLRSEIEPIATKENLAISVRSIMNMPEIDAEISRLFVDAISTNIAEATEHERNAIESNKEYDNAPGNDEELHPRILTPEIIVEDTDELSIDALSTTGTVEDID